MMEISVEKQNIRMKEDLKTEMQEHAVDSELILPDTCPDIARILKCKGEPKLFSKQISGGMLTIEGTTVISLLYVDETGGLCYYHQNLPLYHEMTVGDEAACAYVVAKMDYCNCRAASARKVEIHGAVSMRVALKKVQEVPIVTRADGAGVEVLNAQEAVTTMVCAGEKNLTVNDEIQVSSGSIRTIMRSSAVVRNGEYKTVTDKAVVKADLEITALYQDMNGSFDTLRAQIPFTQILDMEEVDDKTDCRLDFEVTALDLRPRTGLDGECKNILVTAGITVTMEATKTLDLAMITDGYSTKCGLGVRRYGGNLQRLVANVKETHLCKQQVELGREISSITDLWCDATVDRAGHNANSLFVSGVLNLMVLAIDADGAPVYLEKALDYTWEHTVDSKGGILLCEPNVSAQNISFTLTGDSTMDIRGELQVSVGVYEQLNVNVITEMTVDESVTPPKPLAPLVLYYAKAGERVFDIARRYNTTCDAITTANGLSESVLSDKKALLIPAV